MKSLELLVHLCRRNCLILSGQETFLLVAPLKIRNRPVLQDDLGLNAVAAKLRV